MILVRLSPFALGLLLAATAFAQNRAERDSLPQAAQRAGAAAPAGEAPGPWILGTIGIGPQPYQARKDSGAPEAEMGPGSQIALKGIAIKVGEHGEATVAYDLELCRMAGAWMGKFTTPMNLMSRGEYPTAMGKVAFTTDDVAGFIADAKGSWKDPRSEPFGPLPPGQARFRGFYNHGGKVILKWDIGGVEVLEAPGFEETDGVPRFLRTFDLAPSETAVKLVLSTDGPETDVAVFSDGGSAGDAVTGTALWGKPVKAGSGDSTETLMHEGGGVTVTIPSRKTRTHLLAMTHRRRADGRRLDAIFHAGALMQWLLPQATFSGSIWPDLVSTTGELSKDTETAYVVDTIKLPDPNPWGAPMFVGGFDFFDAKTAPDASGLAIGKPQFASWEAAVCTFHGDVFLVSGLDEKLEHVTWKRFATGLYHALGLKIVNGEIYVTCRDGLWRLKDLNGDGEADFYEAFNFDVKVTRNFHEFVFDLQTDPAGNFYFAKAGPVKNGGRGFDQIMAHHGALLRVSPDGAKLDVVATGFRAPTGIGVGPRGELSSGDNEGTWTPACKINWIKPGGFYGVVPLAHRDPLPTSYDPPLCWLPKRVDNSGGSQVWAPEGERWGPWGGRMLHLSYGQAALYGVMFEELSQSAIRNPQSAIVQGGVTKFPLQFQSGIMRARFNPKDGQLYVAGLRGWQTSGLKNGCLQRVRYTGAETRMPVELHVKKDGIELRFATSLDTQSARDPENWHLEQWRYLWSSAYGSPELSAEGETEAPAEAGKDGSPQFTKAQMGQAKHDPVTVKSVTIGTDDRTVFLEIPGLKPVMQMSIKYDLKTAEGHELRGEVVNTIHALGD